MINKRSPAYRICKRRKNKGIEEAMINIKFKIENEYNIFEIDGYNILDDHNIQNNNILKVTNIKQEKLTSKIENKPNEIIVNNFYTKKDLYKYFNVSDLQQGGKWNNGYCEHNNKWFIFFCLIFQLFFEYRIKS